MGPVDERTAPDPFAGLTALFGRIEASTASGPVAPGEALETAAGLIQAAAEAGGGVFFIGNGASQAIASHMSADLTKNGRLRAVAFTDPSLLTCVGNDLGYDEVFAEPLRTHARAGDVLVAISSSGASANILAAVGAARQTGCSVVTLSGFAQDNPLRGSGDVDFYVPSDVYGLVEVVHHGICHALADIVIGTGG